MGTLVTGNSLDASKSDYFSNIPDKLSLSAPVFVMPKDFFQKQYFSSIPDKLELWNPKTELMVRYFPEFL